MRYLIFSLALVAVAAMATSAAAQDGKKGDDPYAGMREKIMKEFDKDGDGKLSEDEREAARGKIRELRIAAAEKQGEQKKDVRKTADKPAERAGGLRGPVQVERVEGRDVIIFRGDKRDVQRGVDVIKQAANKQARPEKRPGPGGPSGMPSPEAMFKKFDKNSDGQLSNDEFKALTEFAHQHMPRPGAPGMRGPGGPRAAAVRQRLQQAKDANKPAQGARAKQAAARRGDRDRDRGRSRDAVARGRSGGPRFAGRGGQPGFGPRFGMRGFGAGGPGRHFQHFQWRIDRDGRGSDRFAGRGGPPQRGRGFGRDFRGPGPRQFAEGRGPRGDGPGRRGGWEGFRGPGPGGPRFAMPDFDRSRRDGDRPSRDGDRPRLGRPDRDGDREGPPGPPRDGETRRRGPDDQPPRDGEGPRREVRRPDGPPPGEGPGRGERAGRRGDGPPERDGDRPGPGGPPRMNRGPGGPGGPPPGDAPGARGDGPRGPRGEGRGGERGTDREERRGPPRDRERGDDDRRPPRGEGDGDGGPEKDKAVEAAA